MIALPSFESGVAKYIIGRAVVEVGFPVDFKGNADVSCKQCKFFRQNYNLCGLNGEVVAYGQHFVGDKCPLERVEEE